MRTRFVQTSNVKAFLAALTSVESRAAREAGMLLVSGPAGHGKSRTAQWWAAMTDAVYVRAKAGMTPHWILTELVTELGFAPERSTEALFGQALTALATKPRAIVVDEVEHTLHDSRVLETVRDVSDLVENTVVLVGMERVHARIKRHAQISSRIARVVQFRAASVEDVALCCREMAEVDVADDLVKEVHAQTQGRLRLVVNAVALIETHAKRNRMAEVSLRDVAGQVLVHDWQSGRNVAVAARR